MQHKGCWRALLWQKLQQGGIKNTDFVGTLAGQGCGFQYDGENEGHVSLSNLSYPETRNGAKILA